MHDVWFTYCLNHPKPIPRRRNSGECNIFDAVELETLVFFLKANERGDRAAVREAEHNVLLMLHRGSVQKSVTSSMCFLGHMIHQRSQNNNGNSKSNNISPVAFFFYGKYSWD